jgi:hypothetical protein
VHSYNPILHPLFLAQDNQVLVSNGKAIILYSYELANSSFRATYANLSCLPADNAGAAELTYILKEQLKNDKSFMQIIETTKDNIKTYAKAVQAAVLASIRFYPICIQNPDRLLWNLHVYSPTTNVTKYKEWNKFWENLTIIHPDYGFGVAIAKIKCASGKPGSPLFCSGCRGVNHILALCPLFDTPGWMGPSCKEVVHPAASATSRN